MLSIVLLAVFGAIIAAVVGTFWYSPKTPMGRLHMRYLGFDKLSKEEQDAKIKEEMPKMPKVYIMQLLLSFLTAFFVVFVIKTSIENGVDEFVSVLFPLMAWFCFAVPTTGSDILWGTCDRKIAWAKFFSDIGSSLVTVLIISLLTILIF